MPTHIQLHPADSAPVETPVVARPRRERPASARPAVRPLHRWYLPCKHAVDFVAALALGLVALPVIALSALVVKADLARPGLLHPDARRPRRPPVHDLQDPHHDS